MNQSECMNCGKGIRDGELIFMFRNGRLSGEGYFLCWECKRQLYVDKLPLLACDICGDRLTCNYSEDKDKVRCPECWADDARSSLRTV